MEKQITAKETVKNMEYLVRLLHKEWERSGRTKAGVCIRLADISEVEKRIGQEIQERQEQLDHAELTFKECMERSKENYILLRLVKKIRKAGERAERKRMDESFSVELDKEEYRLFFMLINIQEAERGKEI